MQRRATIWILGAFNMSLSEGIEAIASLIPIKLYLQKLVGRSQLYTLALPPNHIIYSLMDLPFNSPKHHHSVFLKSLTSHQRSNIKGHLVDLNNKAYGIFLSFSPHHPELLPGSRIIDNFLDWFFFNLSIKNKNKKIHYQQLDNMVLEVPSSNSTAIIISDASIKNNIATSISHVYIANQPLIKMLHYAVLVTITETELFVIRCGINQACSKDNISKIIVVTNSIYMAKKYSIQYRILTKAKLWPFSAISINFSSEIKAIQLNCGSALANLTGTYTKQLIETPNRSISYLPSLVRCHKIIAKKSIAIISSTLGKWPFKPQMEKDDNSLT